MGNSPWPLPPWAPMRSLGEPWRAGFQGGESPWQVRAGKEWRWGELGCGGQGRRIHSFTFHSFSKYLLSMYNMSGTVSGAGDTAGNKSDMIPALLELTLYWGDRQETY